MTPKIGLIPAVFIALFTFLSCAKKAAPDISISFNVAISTEKNRGIVAAYTNDPDTLWTNRDWAIAIKEEMKILSKNYQTVLLFDSRDHTPDIEKYGMQYPEAFDKWMVCGYWRYPNGSTKYCWGGMKPNGNFIYCDE